MPRIKTVFNSQMVAHVWAQLKQPHGRNAQNNMSFDGSLAYSYAQPIAHIVETAGGQRVALFTSRKWSPTTNRHQSHYSSAASHLARFTVPDILRGRYHAAEFSASAHDVNLAHFLAEYREELAELMRAPSESWRVANRDDSDDSETATTPTRAHSSLRGYASDLQRYAETFGCKFEPLPWQIDGAAVIARRDRLLNDPKRVAKRAAREAARAKVTAERAAKEYALNIERVEQWRANAIGSSYHRISDAAGNAMLRVARNGASVETSWGAAVPIADARRAIAFYQRVQAAHSTALVGWSAANADAPELSVGDFTIRSIGTDGLLTVGCHTIGAAEIGALAAVLGAA